MGKIIKISALFISVLALLPINVTLAAFNEKTVQSYIDKSLERRLHDNTSWHDLLHYRANVLSRGYTSQADSDNFFFDDNGKTDPKSELVATIRAMFKPIPIKNQNRHPQCLFVARKNWLIDQFPDLVTVLPKINCDDYLKWINSIQPNSVTLAFPSAYINNPGSMFGHTLLRIDPPKTKEKSNLTSYAITYAANTDETNGLLFAIKGLAGGYPGLFDILPYYDKVNEYNDLENRDIWEYELNLTPKESTRLLQHMWEVREVIFDYYFLDENCSYQLLALLDVARPGLNLAAEFPVEVIPVDTVRVIQEKKMVTKVLYRPSLLTNLKYQLEEYSGDNLALILDLIHGKENPSNKKLQSLTEKDQIYILEITYNYLQYLYKSNEMTRTDYAKRSLTLLKARNKLEPDINLPLAPRPDILPDQGHRSSRLIASIGSKESNDFFEFNWRPAYHDLLDSNDGFVDGLQINFLDIAARYHSENKKVSLQHFDFINIYSIKPRTKFFNPYSWKVKIALSRLPILDDNDKLTFNVNGGGGVSYQLFDSLRAYGLIEGTALVRHDLKNSTSFAIGPNVGFLWQVSNRWRMWLDATTQYYDSHNDLTYQHLELGQSYSVSKNYAIRLHWQRDGNKQDLQNELKIGLNWYY